MDGFSRELIIFKNLETIFIGSVSDLDQFPLIVVVCVESFLDQDLTQIPSILKVDPLLTLESVRCLESPAQVKGTRHIVRCGNKVPLHELKTLQFHLRIKNGLTSCNLGYRRCLRHDYRLGSSHQSTASRSSLEPHSEHSDCFGCIGWDCC